MDNNFILKTLLKSVMPTVTKFVESGKIDALLQKLKSEYSAYADAAKGESVEILISTEDYNNEHIEYANIIVIDNNLQITAILQQQRLSEIITALFNQADM